MNNPLYPYSYQRSLAMRAGAPRSRKAGCLRGCLNLAGIAFILMIALAIVSRFVPIPLLVYVNPVPYFFQYSHIVHKGQDHVYSVAWSPDGTSVASVSDTRTVQVWAVSDDHIQIVYHAPANSAVIPLAWSPNSRYIALADTAHAALVLNVSSGHTMFAAANAPTGGHSLAWSSDSTMIAAVNQQSQVQVWNIARGQTRFTITSVRADAVAWSPNGTYLASVGQDGAVRIWKASDGQGVATLPAQSKYDITSAPMWSPNSKELAFQLSTLDNESVKVWDVASGRQAFSYTLPKNKVSHLLMAWSPDGNYIAIAGSLDGSIQVWDVSTDQQVLSYGGHTTAAFLFAREPSSGTPTINAFAWSPDGSRIVSAGSEETVQIWDATNGHTLYVLSGGDRSFYASLDGIDAVAWSPDGKQVVLGCGRDAEIWHPA